MAKLFIAESMGNDKKFIENVLNCGDNNNNNNHSSDTDDSVGDYNNLYNEDDDVNGDKSSDGDYNIIDCSDNDDNTSIINNNNIDNIDDQYIDLDAYDEKDGFIVDDDNNDRNIEVIEIKSNGKTKKLDNFSEINQTSSSYESSDYDNYTSDYGSDDLSLQDTTDDDNNNYNSSDDLSDDYDDDDDNVSEITDSRIDIVNGNIIFNTRNGIIELSKEDFVNEYIKIELSIYYATHKKSMKAVKINELRTKVNNSIRFTSDGWDKCFDDIAKKKKGNLSFKKYKNKYVKYSIDQKYFNEVHNKILQNYNRKYRIEKYNSDNGISIEDIVTRIFKLLKREVHEKVVRGFYVGKYMEIASMYNQKDILSCDITLAINVYFSIREKISYDLFRNRKKFRQNYIDGSSSCKLEPITHVTNITNSIKYCKFSDKKKRSKYSVKLYYLSGIESKEFGISRKYFKAFELFTKVYYIFGEMRKLVPKKHEFDPETENQICVSFADYIFQSLSLFSGEKYGCSNKPKLFPKPFKLQ